MDRTPRMAARVDSVNLMALAFPTCVCLNQACIIGCLISIGKLFRTMELMAGILDAALVTRDVGGIGRAAALSLLRHFELMNTMHLGASGPLQTIAAKPFFSGRKQEAAVDRGDRSAGRT
jgi:hypothetical protein